MFGGLLANAGEVTIGSELVAAIDGMIPFTWNVSQRAYRVDGEEGSSMNGAAAAGDIGLLRELVCLDPANVRSKQEALVVACFHGRLDCVRYLLGIHIDRWVGNDLVHAASPAIANAVPIEWPSDGGGHAYTPLLELGLPNTMTPLRACARAAARALMNRNNENFQRFDSYVRIANILLRIPARASVEASNVFVWTFEHARTANEPVIGVTAESTRFMVPFMRARRSSPVLGQATYDAVVEFAQHHSDSADALTVLRYADEVRRQPERINEVRDATTFDQLTKAMTAETSSSVLFAVYAMISNIRPVDQAGRERMYRSVMARMVEAPGGSDGYALLQKAEVAALRNGRLADVEVLWGPMFRTNDGISLDAVEYVMQEGDERVFDLYVRSGGRIYMDDLLERDPVEHPLFPSLVTLAAFEFATDRWYMRAQFDTVNIKTYMILMDASGLEMSKPILMRILEREITESAVDTGNETLRVMLQRYIAESNAKVAAGRATMQDTIGWVQSVMYRSQRVHDLRWMFQQGVPLVMDMTTDFMKTWKNEGSVMMMMDALKNHTDFDTTRFFADEGVKNAVLGRDANFIRSLQAAGAKLYEPGNTMLAWYATEYAKRIVNDYGGHHDPGTGSDELIMLLCREDEALLRHEDVPGVSAIVLAGVKSQGLVTSFKRVFAILAERKARP